MRGSLPRSLCRDDQACETARHVAVGAGPVRAPRIAASWVQPGCPVSLRENPAALPRGHPSPQNSSMPLHPLSVPQRPRAGVGRPSRALMANSLWITNKQQAPSSAQWRPRAPVRSLCVGCGGSGGIGVRGRSWEHPGFTRYAGLGIPLRYRERERDAACASWGLCFSPFPEAPTCHFPAAPV